MSIACIALLGGCASYDPLRSTIGSYRNYTKITGKIEGDRYYSPANNFSCAVPPLIKPGAVIRDTSNKTPDGSHVGTVGFEDDLGSLYRVDWFEVAPDLAGSLPDRELLERIFNYQMATYQQLMPNVFLEAKEFSESKTNLTLFFSARIPKGSTIVSNGHRLDCSRASLIVRQGSWTYTLTTQDSNILGQKETTVEERKTALASTLNKFLAGFEFK